MDNVKVEVQPSFNNSANIIIKGWKPLRILYSFEYISNSQFLFWKIENTEKIFKILDTEVYKHHGLNITEHFKVTLESLRSDYLEWESAGFPEEWMKNYENDYKDLIYK